ncbi:MAG: 3-dehydroquinate dehydratase [Lysobacter sp.]|nr:3-dehydroquinate dehydratase [Lysobacter sp.]
MSIAIIRSPDAPPPRSSGMSTEVVSLLVERASLAGKALALRNCDSDAEVFDCLGRINDSSIELVLFDPGRCACVSERLRARLNQLKVPYIEVHDDHFGALENPLSLDCGPRLRLIQGYGSQSYTLALSIALEHLGCGECGNDVHVGT